MAVAKMIYFSGDTFEQATEGTGKGDASKRINELILKGIAYEKNDGRNKLGMREAVEFLYKSYNKKNPDNPIV